MMKPPDEENPAHSLSDETRAGSDEAERLPSRLERYAKAKVRSSQMSEFMQSVGDELWVKLDSCGGWMKFHHYFTVGVVRLAEACWCRKHLICPLCAIRRGAKQLAAYLERYQIIMAQNPGLKTSMVTLTVKNGPDLKERLEHLMHGVKALNQRRRDFLRGKGFTSEWSKVLGLVGTYEFTKKDKGWHPHCHMIVVHEFPIDVEALAAEWKRITGDSWICDVRPLLHPGEPAKDFVEVFKYAMKFGELTLEDNYQAFLILSGRRLIFSQGLFRGVKVPDSQDDELIENLPYVELFYKYINGAGYTLAETKKFEGKEND